ncbi:unnamed protein product [Rotaria sordida]|uniref:Uncharacterized protein n=1 Tax=Rotaria sordida TaxID=392033 RepID=A0A813Y004_9BILA|nr:unnamed protein product [Rotaria sordida]
MQLCQQVESMYVLINTTNNNDSPVKIEMDISYQLIPKNQINLHYGLFGEDKVQALKSSCTNLFRFMKQKNIFLKEAIETYPIIQIKSINNIKN